MLRNVCRLDHQDSPSPTHQPQQVLLLLSPIRKRQTSEFPRLTSTKLISGVHVQYLVNLNRSVPDITFLSFLTRPKEKIYFTVSTMYLLK